MPAPAQSFSVTTDSADRVRREVELCLARVTRPAGAMVFVSGRLAEGAGAVADAIAPALGGVPALVVSGAAALSDAGEFENQSAATGLAWAGGRPEVLVAPGGDAEDVAQSLAQQLSDRIARRPAPTVAFLRPDGFSPQALEPLSAARGLSHLFGAGSTGPVAAIDAEGRVHSGGGVAMVLRGLSSPSVRASPACRLLMPLRRITETRGSMVTKIEAEAALDVLTAVGNELSGQPLLFAVLAPEQTPESERPELIIRGVQGVDPVRRGLMISDEVEEGMHIAFGIRDAVAARSDMERTVREMHRGLAGAVPRFALYLSCAGRGSSLYGAPDVDGSLIRTRFAGLPMAGMQSSFEIAPYQERPTLQLYTGVLALFSAPS
jgi:small ligand-binding sensory domain FIST